jgi:acetyl-CoA C-acetyltransferase
VKIAGSGASSDTLALHDRKDMLYFDTAKISAAKAMKQAGVLLDDIDLFEYHDVFSIYAALQLEAVGFAVRGQGWKLAAEGWIGLRPTSGDGDSARQIPCATLGGMKARGFPGGAAGVYQAVEAATQLRGQAGSNQIPNAKTALVQSLGGPASTAVSHILQTLD